MNNFHGARSNTVQVHPANPDIKTGRPHGRFPMEPGIMIAKKSAFALAAIACAATAMPTMASAQNYGQSYGSYGSYGQNQAYYDPCVREQRERQAGSGMLGAAIGAIAGSQVASRGRRTEGSLLGGVLGAAIGAGVGRGTAACTPGNNPPAAPVYYETRPTVPNYEQRDYRRENTNDSSYEYYRDYPQDYDRGYSKPAPVDDGCRLAESEIRMPDGRVETRHVRTCPDNNGRYRIVD